jgi:HigB_toxin, RelE-like toxic component of a toxin-antitoxin system
VFNIKENGYRLVVAVDFEKGVVWIKWIGTRVEIGAAEVRIMGSKCELACAGHRVRRSSGRFCSAQFCTEVARPTRFERVTFAFGQWPYAANRGTTCSINRKNRVLQARDLSLLPSIRSVVRSRTKGVLWRTIKGPVS